MNPAPPTAPIPTRLPLPPDSEHFSEGQWRVLMALMDAIVPAVEKMPPPGSLEEATSSTCATEISGGEYQTVRKRLEQDGINTGPLDAFLAETPSTTPLFADLLRLGLAHAPASSVKRLSLLLSLLGTRAGTLMLAGYATPVDQLSVDSRMAIIDAWRKSRLATLRGTAKTLLCLTANIFTRTSPNFPLLTGFPNAPPNWAPIPSYPFKFEQFAPSSETTPAPAQLETDIVIVGSGCGGGVCAANLAAAGHRVLVVDKGYHFPTESLPLGPAAGFAHLFDSGGPAATDDGSLISLSASCWGGGGTVNWSASLQPQSFVRREWAEDHGLPFFASPRFQDCLDRVCERMGVHDSGPHNHANRLLLEGARRLGYGAKPVPQNTRGRGHSDGHCTFGCSTGDKQGPANRWLPDAAAHGARFVEGMKVDRVLFETADGGKGGKTVVAGVVGTWRRRAPDGDVVDNGPGEKAVEQEVVIKAKRVIVSCGSLQSPLLLLRSGLKNAQIGRNLHMHPVFSLTAIFDHEFKPWEGACLTSMVTSFEDLDGKGHGVKLQAMSMMPAFALTSLHTTTGLEFKKTMLRYRHMNGMFALCRDRDPGFVYPDPQSGQPRIAYTPSSFDRAHMLVGLVGLARILHAQDAREIHAPLPGLRPYVRTDTAIAASESDMNGGGGAGDPHFADAEFETWLSALKASSLVVPDTAFVSAHQMGTCRMSAAPRDGVVDGQGRVWGTEGLYVADASVFPSASGVNPSISTLAISDWISRGISADLAKETGTASR